jgi:hypothetical protein
MEHDHGSAFALVDVMNPRTCSFEPPGLERKERPIWCEINLHQLPLFRWSSVYSTSTSGCYSTNQDVVIARNQGSRCSVSIVVASGADVDLPDHDGKIWRLSDHLKLGPVLLVFYRGDW